MKANYWVQAKPGWSIPLFMCMLAFTAALSVSCGKRRVASHAPGAAKQPGLVLGIREDHKLYAYYPEPGVNKMSFSDSTNGGPLAVSFKAWRSGMQATQSIVCVTGQITPLDPDWDYISCTVQIDSEAALDVLFSGIFSTNSSNTNTEGTWFSCPAGRTHLNLAGQLAEVFDKPKSRFSK